MHNNYYFLRQLSGQLEEILSGFTLVSCFSQDKDELVIEFNNGKHSLFLKCTLLPDIQCLSFPASFHRARKNSIDLFPELLMKQVSGVRQFKNERSLGLQFDGEWLLVFKMHGTQANVLLFKGKKVASVFRHHLPADLTLNPDWLDREIDLREETFLANPSDARQRMATFGKQVWKYLEEMGYADVSPAMQWKLIEKVKGYLEASTYIVARTETGLKLTLLPTKHEMERFTDPLRALNSFLPKYLSESAFQRERSSLLSAVRGRIKQCEIYLGKTKQRLAELDADQHYAYWADLIMANLHRLSAGIKEALLEDFHDPGKKVLVSLKPTLSPQKNAEVFYRKSRNQAIEKARLTETETVKEKELHELKKHEQLLLQAQTRVDLEPGNNLLRSQEKEKQKVALPYQEFTFAGFTILVGKNAVSNDKLTLHHAHKEDLWLHAKDVAGSHVVIRHQAGKTFPKDVVAHAASLAAYHSKRRNESLCPVTVTSVKYVRKRKGDPAGMVVIQKEKVVMADPRDTKFQ